jgi:hypothetical protein
MKKIVISIFIVLFLVAVLSTSVKAIDLNSLFSNITSTSDNVVVEEDDDELLTTTTTGPETSASTQTSSTRATLPEEGLGLQNILNILLIVVGTLLILLSIAILIRLKK